MPRIPLAVRTLVLSVAAIVCATASSSAQSHEERARMILQLFETGQSDSAYQLIEPLKKEARFVPAVIYTRAQMTPDDRALNLYREIIALEPGGGFADDAVYQLVRRYVEKRDSMAAYTWSGVLNTNYPRSPFLAVSDELLKGVVTWVIDDGADDITGEKSAGSKPVASTKKTDAAKPAETYSKSGMRGFALQVGLFPTKSAAEKRATELRAKKLKAVPLPKMVDGKKHYALVVGPYKSPEEAGKKKPGIASSCACPAFIVKVE
ncbi:MAG: SPOR domain-containing protein [bacterium]|nr:SPOR domain-containing protein [Candidatus Kapabacteria bacterium]